MSGAALTVAIFAVLIAVGNSARIGNIERRFKNSSEILNRHLQNTNLN